MSHIRTLVTAVVIAFCGATAIAQTSVSTDAITPFRINVPDATLRDLNERLRALGLTVYDPELSAFTLGGGGAHCLMQAIRRERVGG